jgi:hypothetical protein
MLAACASFWVQDESRCILLVVIVLYTENLIWEFHYDPTGEFREGERRYPFS